MVRKRNKKTIPAFWAGIVLLLTAIYYYFKKSKTMLFPYNKAALFIAGFEGFSQTAYADYKQWSIGYGTYAGPLYSSGGSKLQPQVKTITKADALSALNKELQPLAAVIMSAGVPLSEGAQVGFASFGYNLGKAALEGLFKRLKNGESLQSVCTSLRKYINAGGKPLTQLALRRGKESDLILGKTTI